MPTYGNSLQSLLKQWFITVNAERCNNIPFIQLIAPLFGGVWSASASIRQYPVQRYSFAFFPTPVLPVNRKGELPPVYVGTEVTNG